jgi:uncharacterized DUF497 family protein
VFDWDKESRAHIARHGVTPEEVEQAVMISPVDLATQYYEGEERFLLLGATAATRVLAVVLTWRDDRMRVVTAYPAPPALREKYWTERREADGD